MGSRVDSPERILNPTRSALAQFFYRYQIVTKTLTVLVCFYLTYVLTVTFREDFTLLRNGFQFASLISLTVIVSPWIGAIYAGFLILVESLYTTTLGAAIAEGVFLGGAIIVTNIIALRYEKFKMDATRDELTGLYNRRVIMPLLEKACERGKYNDAKCAMSIIDIDFFKTINDTYGHEAGDRLLQEFARRLETCVRPTDIVARVGGDEFMVLLQQIASVKEVLDVVGRLKKRVGEKYAVGGKLVESHISCGVAVFPEDTEHCGALFDIADKNLYMAKEAGRNAFYMNQQRVA